MDIITKTQPKQKPAPIPGLFQTEAGLTLANAIVHAVRGGK